jgi:ABC-type Mn2+/Zn2+ transport system permease subunit
MLDWLTEPFQLAFMQRALLAGVLVVVISSVVGTWVVLRGMTFLGDALAHGVLPGIALGVLIGFSPTLGAVASAAVMVAGINLVHRYSKMSEDTGIGLLFVGMLASGVILISKRGAYTGQLNGILFGDALGVSAGDLVLLVVATAVTLILSRLLHRSFLTLAFNEQKAEVLGLRPGRAHVAMLALVTMAVAVSFRTVGTLLVFGLLVAPPAGAALIARRVPAMMVVAGGLGVVAVLAGLVISFHAGTATGATMAGLAVAIFFAILLVRNLFGRR